MKRAAIGPVLLLPLLVLAGALYAAPADDWESGTRAFESGDYASALLFFEAARDSGLDAAAVHYNIAVSQFKLQRYEAAWRTFALIADRYPPMRGLAEYNLGLVARRLGDTAEARVHFLRAYEVSPDNRTIRVLASRRLRESEPDVGTASRWTGAIGVRAGNDDNVALRDETVLPAGTAGESPMADLFHGPGATDSAWKEAPTWSSISMPTNSISPKSAEAPSTTGARATGAFRPVFRPAPVRSAAMRSIEKPGSTGGSFDTSAAAP